MAPVDKLLLGRLDGEGRIGAGEKPEIETAVKAAENEIAAGENGAVETERDRVERVAELRRDVVERDADGKPDKNVGDVGAADKREPLKNRVVNKDAVRSAAAVADAGIRPIDQAGIRIDGAVNLR